MARGLCLYFASIDWGHTWQRPQQLAARLAQRLEVVYVEPLGLRRPRLRDLARLFRGGPAGGPDGAVAGLLRHPRGPYLPWPGVDWVERWNGRRLARALRRRLGDARVSLAWVGVPSRAVLAALRAWPDVPVVYDGLDDFAAFHGDSAFVRETEARCVRGARLALATSVLLEQRLRALNPATERLPNAADVARFAAALDGPAPPQLARLGRPIAGYCGELGPWFDSDGLAGLARKRPEVAFVLVGPVAAEVRRALRGLHNVHLMGPRPYAEVPAWVARSDVALVPFKPGALTAAVNPIKVYEYLAVGAPIVATGLPELEPLAARGLVRLTTQAGLPAALDQALAERDPALRLARRAEAEPHTWEARAARLFALLETHGLLPAQAPA